MIDLSLIDMITLTIVLVCLAYFVYAVYKNNQKGGFYGNRKKGSL